MVEQSRRKFSLAIPTKGEGDAALPSVAQFAEIRIRPRLCP